MGDQDIRKSNASNRSNKSRKSNKSKEFVIQEEHLQLKSAGGEDDMRRSYGIDNFKKVADGTYKPPKISFSVKRASALSNQSGKSVTSHKSNSVSVRTVSSVVQSYQFEEDEEEQIFNEGEIETEKEEEEEEEEEREAKATEPQKPVKRIPLQKTKTKCFPCMDGFIETVLKMSEKEDSDEEEVQEKPIKICMQDKPPKAEVTETVLIRPSILSKPQKEAFAYMAEKKIEELISFLIGHILCKAPSDPLTFVVKILDHCLEFRSGFGDPPLLFDKCHQEIIYKGLDPSGAGIVTYEQYKNGLKTMGITNYNKTPRRTKDGLIEKDTFLREADRRLIAMLVELVCTSDTCSSTHIANLINRKKKPQPCPISLPPVIEEELIGGIGGHEQEELYYKNYYPEDEFPYGEEFGEGWTDYFSDIDEKFDYSFTTLIEELQLKAIQQIAEESVVNELSYNVQERVGSSTLINEELVEEMDEENII